MDGIQGADPGPQSPRSRVAALETAIVKNRAAKAGLPECPCWGNATRLVDAELYAAADACKTCASAAARCAALEGAVRRHREAMTTTPECTCWNTSSAKADSELYTALGNAT